MEEMIETETSYLFRCPEENGFFPNPHDCSAFYHCYKGHPWRKRCPASLYFSSETLECKYACNAPCDTSSGCDCLFEGCGDYNQAQEVSPDDSLLRWDFECVSDGLYWNPENCTTYIHCSNELAFVMHCPAGLHFSSETKSCEHKCDAHCDEGLAEECHWDESGAYLCTLRPDKGPCKGTFFRYYYDSGACRQFVYGGCGGNANNFASKEECLSKCYEEEATITNEIPEETYNSEIDYECATDGLYGNPEDCSTFIHCSNGIAYVQSCPKDLHFNSERRRCEAKCEAHCDWNLDEECDWKSSVICRLPAYKGPCDGSLKRYFFDAKSGRCRKFEYGGCHGNGNNFENQEECEDVCQNIDSPDEYFYSDTIEDDWHQGACDDDGVYPDPTDCRSYSKCSNGSEYGRSCPYGMHFSEGLKRCVAPCDAHCNQTIACQCGWPECTELEADCEVQPVRGPCHLNLPRHYYDRDSGRCRKFLYGGCGGNTNNFLSDDECTEKCQKKLLGGYRCPASNGKFANFYDCISYYHCKKGIPVLKRCPRGMAFDHKMAECVIEFEAHCLYKCRDRDAVYPYHPDCQKYVDCVNGISKVEKCPLGQAFDWRTNECVDASAVGCHPL